MERWMALEMGRLRASFVVAPRVLGDLVLEPRAAAPTQGGGEHVFDAAVLRRLHESLGPLARRRLRVPVTFYVDKDLPEDAYVADEAAIELLRALGEVPAALDARDGRLWLSHARARDIAERHPTAFQFSFL